MSRTEAEKALAGVRWYKTSDGFEVAEKPDVLRALEVLPSGEEMREKWIDLECTAHEERVKSEAAEAELVRVQEEWGEMLGKEQARCAKAEAHVREMHETSYWEQDTINKLREAFVAGGVEADVIRPHSRADLDTWAALSYPDKAGEDDYQQHTDIPPVEHVEPKWYRTDHHTACPVCHGKGQYPQIGSENMQIKCQTCDGTGSVTKKCNHKWFDWKEYEPGIITQHCEHCGEARTKPAEECKHDNEFPWMETPSAEEEDILAGFTDDQWADVRWTQVQRDDLRALARRIAEPLERRLERDADILQVQRGMLNNLDGAITEIKARVAKLEEGRRREMKENDIQHDIVTYLKARRCKVIRVNAGKVCVGGHWIELADEVTPDIVGCLPDGRFFAVEVKRPGYKTKGSSATVRRLNLQRDYLTEVINRGGMACVATCAEDVARLIFGP